MGAFSSRICLLTTGLIALLALGLSPLALAANTPRPGTGCAHAVALTLRSGEKSKIYPDYSLYVERPHGGLPYVAWGSSPTRNYIACSARIQLDNGSWVGPTRINPSGTPTPFSGEYRETTDPQSRFRQVVVRFARSPVPRGASCDYPLTSAAYAGEGIDIRDYSVAFRVGTPSVGQDELDVSIHNPRVVVCGAMVEERGGENTENILRTFHPAIGPRGGLSSPLPQPPEGTGAYLYARVYARVEPVKHSPT